MTKSWIRNLALSTALLGLMAGGVAAAEPITDDLLYAAVFGVSVGGQDASETENSVDITPGIELTFQGDAAVNIPLGDMISFQLDGSSELYDRNGDEDDASGAHVLGGHLSYRDPGMGLLGVFAGTGLGTSIDSDDGGDGLGFLAGAEGQMYFGNATIYAQGGWADFVVDNGPEGFTDGWFVGAEGRYFIHEDMMLSANVAYGETPQYETDGRGTVWNWGAGGKMRVADTMPIYGTLDYRGGQYTDVPNTTEQVTEHAVLIGLEFGFGAANLLENDRRGATLSTPMLPSRAAAWTEAVD